MPPATTLTTRLSAGTALALCFVRILPELAPAFDLLSAQLPASAHAWIVA